MTLYFPFFKKKLSFLSSAIRYLLSNLEVLRFSFICCFVWFFLLFHNNSVGFCEKRKFVWSLLYLYIATGCDLNKPKELKAKKV